jgi:hypothetical protein
MTNLKKTNMKNLFGSTIEQLQNKSKNTLDIFTKTIRELTQINEEAKIEVTVRSEKISSLIDEKNTLINVIYENEKVISKIQNILE